MKRTEESMPRHRTETITWDSEPEARRRLLNSEFCGRCEKLSLKTKADAHSYIGLLISKPGRIVRPKQATLAPYKCPHGNGWHVGQDPKTADLLRGKK
jgi:hypothetical protein